MEEDFPRGSVIRRTTRSTDEKKKCFVQLSVKRGLEDVLFKDSEQATPSKGKKKRKTKKTEGEETEEPNLEEEFEGATETEGFIPKTLTAKTLSEGMLVLAVVQEIHEYEIVLSLPNGQTAFVQITDVSSFFTQQLQELNESNGAEDQDLPNIRDVYQVGNLVPCKVKSLGASKDGHRRIQASLDYKEVNSELGISFIKAGMTLHGCVSSVEDHGYTIDLGIRGTNAFLAKEEATKGPKGRKGVAMKTGKLVTCLVKAVKANGRSIILTFDQERLKSCKATKTTHTTFSSLIPGTKLDAMVTKVLSNSLIMDIFGLYKGCVDPIHLKDTADELAKYDIGQKLVAVVLYNCPTTKSIGLSLNPAHHKTTFDPASDVIRGLSPGDIIEAALVVRVQEKENLIVQLNPLMRGIVYHSHVSDDKQKRYSPASVGEKVRCRILSFNFFDRLAIVSMRKSILDKPFLGINDVKPGMLVKGVIESVMSRGVAVKIQDRIHGFVPRTHLADIPVQKPQERFTIGSEIELRVLLVEPAKRRVLLTHKKTMVKSSLPILASYAQPKLGMWAHGCVVAVKDFGCIVSFYNDVKGIIPRSELGMDESSSPTDNFYVGQVLKCRVHRTHSPESKKLALSLRKDGRKERESFEAGKNSATEISPLERISRNGTEQDRQIEEPEEENELDLLDEQENAMREMEVERRIETQKEEEKTKKRKKIKEFDRDTQSQIDYFQEIAESLKAFACMMVDMKVVKVEIKGIKSMLQELTGKKTRDRERVREDNARDERQKEREREKMDAGTAMLENDLVDDYREERDKFESDYGTNVNVVEDENYGYSEESDDEAGGFVDILGDDSASDSGDNGFGIEERGARRIDEDSGRLDKVGEEDNRSVAKIRVSERDKEDSGQERISGKATSSERVTTGVEKASSKKRIAWEKLSKGVIRHLYEKAISKGNFARSVLRKLVDDDILVQSTCYGKSQLSSRRPRVKVIDPDILEYVLKTTCDVYGIEESDQKECHRESVANIDAFCGELFRKFLQKQSRIGRNEKESSEGTDEGRTEMVRNDNDARDQELDLRQNEDSRRKEDSVLGITDRDKTDGEVVRLEREFPGKKLSKSEIFGLHSRGIRRAYFAQCVVTKLISRDILKNSNCSGKRQLLSGRPNVRAIDPDILQYALETTYDVYGVKEHEKEKCRRECVQTIDSHCRHLSNSFTDKFNSPLKRQTKKPSNGEGMSEKKAQRTEMLRNGPGQKVGELSYRMDDMERRKKGASESVGGGKRDDAGGSAVKGSPWKRLSDKDVAGIRSCAKSMTNFVTTFLRKIVSDEILVNSNCSGVAGHSSGRPNVQRIDPDILSYICETTFNVYGIEECDKKKCITKCTKCIDAHCRYLFWKQCMNRSRKGTTDSSVNESVPKDGKFESRQDVEKERVQSATGNDANKESEIESIEEGGHWESLSDEDVAGIRSDAKSMTNFVTAFLRKIVSDEILVNSNCSGIARSGSGRPNVRGIDPEILSYIFETTFNVYGIEECDKKKCIKECTTCIDAHCRYLFWKLGMKKSRKGTTDASVNENESVPKDGRLESRHDIEKERVRSATGNDANKESDLENIEEGGHWETLSDEDIINIHTSAKSMTTFVTASLRKIVSDEILVNSNCSGVASHGSGRPNVRRINPDILSYICETTFNVYGIEECDKKKCIKECTKCIDSHCRYLFRKHCMNRSRKGTTDASVNESVPKDGRLESRHDIEKDQVQSTTGNDANKDSEIEEGGFWESLSDEDIIDIHTRARSRGDFAKSVLRKIVGDDTLISSSSSSDEMVKSAGLQPIDPDILSYVIRSTYDVYGVTEDEKTKCHSECFDAIDSYCKYLRDNR